MITPSAKKSDSKEWFIRHMTSGDIYPGVPLVYYALFGLYLLATPKSVIRRYPFS